MGYCIFQREAEFRIKKENFNKVIKSIKSLKGKETIACSSEPHFSFVVTEEFINSKNIEDIFSAWRWEVNLSQDGDVDSILFTGEKLGDEDILFSTIAEYLEVDSYIEMIGEDGNIWKWVFDGKFVYKVAAIAIFDEPSEENRLDINELTGWVQFNRDSYNTNSENNE